MADPTPAITGRDLAAQLLEAAKRSAQVLTAAQEAARKLQQGTPPPAPRATPGGTVRAPRGPGRQVPGGS